MKFVRTQGTDIAWGNDYEQIRCDYETQKLFKNLCKITTCGGKTWRCRIKY